MTWLVEEERALRGYAVEWVDADEILVSRANAIYRVDRRAAPSAGETAVAPHIARTRPVHGPPGATVPLEPIVQIAAPTWRNLACAVRPVQRLLRHMVYNVVKLSDGALFITFAKSVGVARRGEYRPLAGLERPCRVLRGGVASAGDGSVFFGEYLTNARRDPIRIYRYAPGAGQLEVVHEFAAGVVRHIHGIYCDPFSDELWCLTGDFGAECRMLISNDGFATFREFGAGDESWRSVSVQFTKQHIYYATDAEFETNRLYRVDRTSGERQVLGQLDGPVYYSCARGDELFFAVTAELCPSQVGRAASLWHVDAEGRLSKLVSFEKDPWPVSFFLPGTIHFPCGPEVAEELFFQTVALRGVDGHTFRLYRDTPV
jgi:hypothetical protein